MKDGKSFRVIMFRKCEELFFSVHTFCTKKDLLLWLISVHRNQIHLLQNLFTKPFG
jgi:hypothetical protein